MSKSRNHASRGPARSRSHTCRCRQPMSDSRIGGEDDYITGCQVKLAPPSTRMVWPLTYAPSPHPVSASVDVHGATFHTYSSPRSSSSLSTTSRGAAEALVLGEGGAVAVAVVGGHDVDRVGLGQR